MSESFTFRHFFASSASFIDAQYHTAEEGLASLCIQFYIMASLPQEHSRNFGSLSAFFIIDRSREVPPTFVPGSLMAYPVIDKSNTISNQKRR